MDNDFNVQNDQPVMTSAKKGISNKPVIIALCIIIAVSIVSVAVVGVFLAVKSGVSHKEIVRSLEAGKYSEARKIFEDKYGYGNSDDELTGVLEDRLVAMQNEYLDGEITYTSAMKEIEVIRNMGIEELDDALAQAEAYIEGNEGNIASGDKQSANKNVSRQEAPDVNLGSEPLPEAPKVSSSAPRITSATTLNGEVLAMSDVNAARSFGANKTIDGYYDSCWCVNTPNTGAAGASIRFNLAQRSTVSGVTLVNGNLYQPYDNLYSKNGQVKSFTLTFSDGSTQTFTASFNGSASSTPQEFYLSNPVETDYITLTVQSGYVGSKFTTNVCLGEFNVF